MKENQSRGSKSLKSIVTVPSESFLISLYKQEGIIPKNFSDFYKVIESLDTEGSMLIVKNYEDLRRYAAICSYHINDAEEIKAAISEFERNKAFLSTIDSSEVLKLHEIFVDCPSIEKSEKVILWRIFEGFQYVLYNKYYLSNFNFIKKHVIKHFEENEIVKIIQKMIELWRKIDSKGKTVSYWNFFVCYDGFEYKILIQDLEDSDQDRVGSPRQQIEYMALLCYGLFKGLVCAYFDLNDQDIDDILKLFKEKKLSKFAHILNIFENLLLENDKSFELIMDRTIGIIEKNLEKYLNVLYAFKNDEIMLLDQPIFKYIKKLHLELGLSFDKVHQLVEFVNRELPSKQNLKYLCLRFRNCCLSPLEADMLLLPLKNLSTLNHLFIDFSENNFNDNNLCILFDSLKDKPMISLGLDLSE